MWLAVALALLTALVFSLSVSVQHHAAETAPAQAHSALDLMGHLLRRPSWLVGQLLSLVGFGLHGLALSNGPVSLVQPIIISGIVFAVPVRAAIGRLRPAPRELGIVCVTALGLAAFLVASRPQEGKDSVDTGLALTLVGCFALAAVVAILVAHRATEGTPRAFLLGTGAGLLFGLVAVLLKLTTNTVAAHGVLHALLAWPAWALLAAGAGGVMVNQLSYRAGRLSASMPVLNIVDCLVALFCGYVVLGEAPRHTSVAVVVEVLGLTAAFWGLSRLAIYEADEPVRVREPRP
jgi:drug/metabolite transporter (DMT)-like permease